MIYLIYLFLPKFIVNIKFRGSCRIGSGPPIIISNPWHANAR